MQVVVLVLAVVYVALTVWAIVVTETDAYWQPRTRVALVCCLLFLPVIGLLLFALVRLQRPR